MIYNSAVATRQEKQLFMCPLTAADPKGLS